jgi:hypothetical protein
MGITEEKLIKINKDVHGKDDDKAKKKPQT